MQRQWPTAVAITLGVMVVGVLILIVTTLARQPAQGPDVLLPLLVIAGTIFLLTTLAIVSLLFAVFGLADQKQALALPDGSIRAVIAVSLIVLFAIVTIFLYDNLSGRTRAIHEMDATQVEAFLKDRPPEQILRVNPDPKTAPPDAKFTVIYRDVPSQPSQDFAKQLMVLLGTLVTSVAGFYFGANSVASAVSAGKGDAGDMKLTGVAPATIPPSGKQQIAINGSNLGKVNDVTFRQGKDTIYAEIDKVEDTKVTCSLSLDGTKSGKWDVIVSDGTNMKKLPDVLEIAPGRA
jgi:hypothetical protein